MAKIKWGFDPTHSEISFKVKHLMITNVKGEFKEFHGEVFTEGEEFITSDINFHINSASIDTGAPDRDAHLKSADFFDAENFNEITFTGKSAEKTDDESFKLTGDFTIKGITKEIKLDVEFSGYVKDPWGMERAGYTLSGKINRKDWGLNWNTALEAGGVLVGDEVKINCDIELVKQA